MAQRVALRLLSLGMGTPGEIAAFAGVSRQLIEGWARCANLDWRRIRKERIGRSWSKELQRGFAVQRKVQRRKRRNGSEGGGGLSPLQDQETLAYQMPDLPT